MLVWNDSEQYHQRYWYHQQQLAQLQALLNQSEQRLVSLQETTQRRRNESHAAQLAEQQIRLEHNLGRLHDLLNSSENGLRQQMLVALSERDVVLARASSQSRLAIARLHDPLVQQALDSNGDLAQAELVPLELAP